MDIVLPKETANDETAVIVAIHVAGGSEVEEDQPLFDAESSKATQEIRAPMAGVVLHDLAVGQEIGFGVPLGRIAPFGSAVAPVRPEGSGPAVAMARSAVAPAGDVADRDADAPPGIALVPPLASLQDNRPNVVAPRPSEVAPSTPHQTEDRSSVRCDPGQHPDAGGLTDPNGRTVGSGWGTGLAAAPRFSQTAAALIAEYGLLPASFGLPFVTAAEVRRHIGVPGARLPAPADAPRKPVSARKRAEIEALGGGALLSVLGVNLGRLAVSRSEGSFLEGRIVDLVIYEAARLMRRYPKLNAAYRDGCLVLHPAVHAGLAIDDGGRLVVYGIADADRMSLGDLAEVMVDAVARYVEDGLTSVEMTRATFTVTDLSDGELDFVLPLLPRGQSCILGITRDAGGGFRLFAGFDHRVTEGREVSSFLGELRRRLLSFSTVEEAQGASAHCLYCERSAAETVGPGKDKGLLKIVDRRGRDALCCASCWNGW